MRLGVLIENVSEHQDISLLEAFLEVSDQRDFESKGPKSSILEGALFKAGTVRWDIVAEGDSSQWILTI